MTFEENVKIIREKKGLSQDELSKKVGTIGIFINHYERHEIKPSIVVATKTADLPEVFMDYLAGYSDSILKKSLGKQISDIQELPQEQKNIVTSCSILSYVITMQRRLMRIKKHDTRHAL